MSSEDAEIYAESLRRGGALVSARVNDADKPRLQAVMDQSSVNASNRAAMYRKDGGSVLIPPHRPITPIRFDGNVSCIAPSPYLD